MATPDDDTDTQTLPLPPTPPPGGPPADDNEVATIIQNARAQAAAPPAAGTDTPIDYGAIGRQLMQQPVLPQPDTTPVKRGWLSLLGEALAGGPETDVMSPAQRERAGLRALGDFGTSLMAGSGYYPGKPMFGGLAEGFQGARRSELGSEQQSAAYLGAQQQYQMQQQQAYLERVKAALPLLRMGAASGIPNVLASAPAVPGTAGGAGRPGTDAASQLAYGQGGPGSTIPVPDEYMPYFEAAAKRNNMPVDLLIAQARQESGFNPNSAGGGLMQIQDKTALKPGFGMAGVQNPAVLKDPKTNIDFGADYLAARAKAAGVDLNTPQGQVVGLQAYNGGGDPDYVKNVTRYMPAPAGGPAPAVYAGPGAPPSGPAAAPAPIAPPPSSTPPAASTAPATPPPTPGAPPAAFADFQAQNPIATTPEEQATLDGLKRVQQQTAIELQNAPLTGVDRVKAVQAAREAADNLATATRQIQDAHTAHQVTLYTGANTLAQQAQLKQQELAQQAAEAERNRQADVLKAKVAAGYTQQQHQIDAEQQTGSKQLEAMGTQAQKAAAIQPMLRELIPLLKNAPSGAIGQILQAHQDWIPALTAANIVPANVGTVAQLVQGLTDYLSLDLKPNATGAMRIGEIPMLKGLLPQLGQSTQAQQQAMARILNYTQRVKDEYDVANENFGAVDAKTGQPNYKILYKNLDAPMQLDENGQRVGGGLGPVVPEPPTPVANPSPGQIEAARRYQKYVANLPSGMPYNTYERQADGSLQRVLKVQP